LKTKKEKNTTPLGRRRGEILVERGWTKKKFRKENKKGKTHKKMWYRVP